ncbi:MAG: TonB family protein [Acidobacteria bacterium]|nr:TonB family protein [Acidobacteriota bacterium]
MNPLLPAALVLFWAVTVTAQAAQAPAISPIGAAPLSSGEQLEFLRIGLPPAFGPAPTGRGGFSIGVYHLTPKARDLTPPVLFYAPDPLYPPAAKRAGTVSVRLSLIVGIDGKPIWVGVLRSAGEEFDKAAAAAVRNWHYYPGAKGGRVWFFQMFADVTFASPPGADSARRPER